MIAQALAETGCKPAATVMIGDTTFDIEMARNAGVGAIGVDWGYHDAEHLRRAGAHAIVACTTTLLTAIDDLLNR